MNNLAVRLMAEAMCQLPGGRGGDGPCDLCQVGAQRAWDALRSAGYLRDFAGEPHRPALIERFTSPRRGRR